MSEKPKTEAYERKTPVTSTAPGRVNLAGHVCIDPEGDPYWPSVSATAEEALRRCFVPADPYRLDDLARAGWVCVPLTALVAAAIA